MGAINQTEALSIALAEVHQLGRASGDEFAILAEETQTTELGWVFFYNSASYIQTGDPRFALAGNGPLLVTKDGKISWLPTAVPWEGVVNKMTRRVGGRVI